MVQFCSYPSEGPAVRREKREGGSFLLKLRPEGRTEEGDDGKERRKEKETDELFHFYKLIDFFVTLLNLVNLFAHVYMCVCAGWYM